MKKCSKCMLPETYETIEFNDSGCNLCHEVNTKKENINWEKRKKDLDELINQFRNKSDYDCIIPFSGGKDSTFQAYYLKKEYNLKPLLIRFNHRFYRKKTEENVEKTIRKLGLDMIDFKPNWQIVKKLMRESFERKTDFCWHCHTGIYSYPIRLAIKLNVPLIVYGEPLAEMSAYYSYDEIEHEDEEKFDNVRTLGISADDMFGMINSKENPIDKRDLIPYTFPDKNEYQKVGIKSICLGNYIKWDYLKQTEIIKKELGWEHDELEGVPDEANPVSSKIECFMQGTRDYIKFIKRGYTRISQNMSVELREGRISTKRAKELISEEGKKPPSLDVFLEYIGMSESEFNDICESMAIPPYKHNFKTNKIAEKTQDFDTWFRENLDDRNT